MNLNTTQTVPIDETKRDANSIKLLPGFKYGAGATGSRLTLQISSYPSYVENGYVNYTTCSNANPNNPLVGEIEGNFSVSLNGSATYEVPIKMSPGTAGMQPVLSLLYSSGSGSGMLGVGWNLTGLSSITRINKVPYLDTKFDAVKLTNSDVFAIDGNRMVLRTGTYGAASSTYATELESFAKITALNQQGNGPASFVVVDKNGTTTEYGATFDSKLTGIGDNTPLSWFANKVTDVYGNYFKYYYKQLNGEVVIDKIEYTLNANAGINAGYNEIFFEYTPKTEKNTYYIGDKQFKSTQLLRSITTKSYGSLVKKYVINYQYSFNTILSDITEVNHDGTQLKSTNFCYDDPYNNGVSQGSSQNTELYTVANDYNSIKTVITADLNGDGFSDALVVKPIPISTNDEIKFEARRNDYPSGALNGGTIGFSSMPVTNNSTVSSNTILATFVSDFDYDDRQEIYLMVNDLSIGNTNKYHIQKIVDIGTATAPDVRITTLKPNLSITSAIVPSQKPTKFYYDIDDYNGDGIKDELIVDPQKITVISSLGDKVFNIPAPLTSVARSFDFDGDGYMEIVLFNNSNVNNTNLSINVLKYTAASSLTSIATKNITFPSSSQDLLKLITIGDYNGDGKADIAYLNETKQNLNILYSTGSNFSASVPVSSFTGLNSSINYNIISPDINGDGSSDIIFTDDLPSSSQQNYTSYYSVGEMFVKGVTTQGKFNSVSLDVIKIYHKKSVFDPVIKKYGSTNVAITEKVNVPTTYELSADFNGDGVFDVVTIDGLQTSTILNSITATKRQFLSKITTGLNRQIDIIYANTKTKFDNQKVLVYDKNQNTYSGSLVSFTPNNYLVSLVKFRNTNLSNLSQDERYSYKGAIYHKFGKGLIGYEKTTKVNTHTLLGTINTFSPNPTYQVADYTSVENAKFLSSNAPDNIYRYYINGATNSFDGLSSKTSYTFQVTPTTAPSIFVAPSKIDSKNYLNSTASVTELTYNLAQNGNVTNKQISYGWPTQPAVRTENITITYQNIGAVPNSLAGIFKPQQVTFTANQTPEATYSRITQYGYTGFNLTSVVNDPAPASNSLTKTLSNYNSFGLAQKITLTASDILPRSVETIFDPTGRFIVKTKNTKLDEENYTYDTKYGSVLTKSNISGLLSKFTYDGLGRLIKTELPDNTVNTITYAYTPLSATDRVYSKTIQNEGAPFETTYYNHLGSLVGTKTQDVNNNEIVSTNYYDYYTGYLSYTEEPHFADINLQPNYLITKYSYESIFGRLIKNELFSAVASAQPNNGVPPTNLTSKNIFTNYEYNPASKDYYNGNFLYNQGSVSVSDNTNKKTVKNNNVAGQLISLLNYEGYTPDPNPLNPLPIPDYQITNYAYFSNGNPKSVTLSSSIDPTPIVHTFAYNALAQQTQLIDPTVGTVNYNYNKLGELLYQGDANGNYNYTYDNIGRIETKTGSTSGLTSYQYVNATNGKNQIEKIIGPNVTTDFTYDALGRPTMYKETVAGGTPKVFTTLADYDKYSNIVKLTYPSGFISKYNYNTNGFLTSIVEDNNNPIWTLNNQNAIGQITDYTYGNGTVNGNGINTTVNYTDLHHLSSINHGSLHKQEYNFDPLTGNLLQRDFHNYSTGTHNREKFGFDVLDRLRNSTQVDPQAFDAVIQTNNVSIDEKGNILYKEDAGDYIYGNTAKPFNLTQINNPTPNISLNTLSCTYNDIKKVSVLSEANTNKQMNFTYGNDDERIKAEYKINGVSQYTRYYQSSYEREETSTNTKEWTYIFAPTGLAAVYYKPTTASQAQLLYALTDHLGSPVLLTNAAQQIQEEYSFDSWGRRRNPVDWTYTVAAPTILNRGFTFHEHIDEFKLINMNGRIYDPVLGRFMQPDNQVQDPGFLQTFNKYAYVFNNPLSYTDPSGWAGSPAQNVYDAPGWGTSYIFSTYGGPGITGGGYGGTGGSGSYNAYDSPMDLIMSERANINLGGGSSGGRGGGSSGTSGVAVSTNVGGKKLKRNVEFDGNVSFSVIYNTSENNDFVPALQESNNNSPVISDPITENESVGQPGDLESIIPIWGNGRSAVDHFQNGNYWRGAGYTALAISDVFLVKSLYTAAAKGGGMIFAKFATKEVSQIESKVFLVTKEGVVLPKGAKIPGEFVENPFRSSSYGIMDKGKFIEKLRIDPATPGGMKGPNFSHFHLDGSSKHLTNNWPWW